jgi:hypothetical protein
MVKNCFLFCALALGLSFTLIQSEKSFAKDKELTAKEVVAGHLKSLGNAGFLASMKTRSIGGRASVQFIQGGTGTMMGQSVVVSAGPCLSIILKYDAVEYPGEYFAFDGEEVTVANIKPGQRSPLGDFIFRYNAAMKEGLLGGVWSLGWPLLDIEKRKPSLKCRLTKVEGRDLYEIEYYPKDGMNSVKANLYFEPGPFRHVRTEYKLKVQGEQALQAGKAVVRGAADSKTVMKGGGSGGIIRDAGIHEQIEDSYYVLVERFDMFGEVRFKESKGNEARSLILPHSYSLEYSVEGQGSTFLAHWRIDADRWALNGNIDSSVFKSH